MAAGNVAKAPPKVRAQRPVRKPWEGRTSSLRKLTGPALQRARKSLFMREPLCRLCRAKGYIKRATIRDHVIPLAEGGIDADDNTQPLCKDCHDIKTREESKRGAVRAKQLR